MDHTLSFDNTDILDSCTAAGACTAVFLLVRKGFLTFDDAKECFGKPKSQWLYLYGEWCKANGLDKKCKKGRRNSK